MGNCFTRFIWAVIGLGAGWGVGSASAQQARIAGLAGDGTYMELLRQQAQLKAREDSTAAELSACRSRFETAAGQRGELGREIVRLESELFEVRNRMGRITAQVAAIEQEYIVSHLDDPAGTAAEGEEGDAGGSRHDGGRRMLYDNPFFVDNLSGTDRRLFAVLPKVEAEIGRIGRQISGLYEQLTATKRQYEAAAEQETIDSLSLRAGELKEQIEQVDAQMEQLWLTIYHRKLDLYSVLLDRIGSIDRLQLEQLDQESRQVRRAERLAGEQLAPLLTTYPVQKRLTLNYESVLAQALGLTQAEDSLKTERGRTEAMVAQAEAADYADIPFEPRSMIVYGAIAKSAERNYTTVDDIPALQVPKRGVYYTVQIGLYPAPPKGIEVFKGLTPVMYQPLGNGQRRYVAGGFATHAEAQAAVAQMTREGLRASVIAFAEGKPVSAAQAKALEAAAEQAEAAARTTGEGRYRVEIIPEELRLSAAAREIIAARAPGKTIVRNSSGNEVVYAVDGFEQQTEAERLAEALRTQPNVKIKVVAL